LGSTGERPRSWQQAERRALVADLVRTQATLQARSEQLEEMFASRWYRLARFYWRLRRGAIFRKAAPPRLAGEDSFARSLDGEAEEEAAEEGAAEEGAAEEATAEEATTAEATAEEGATAAVSAAVGAEAVGAEDAGAEAAEAEAAPPVAPAEPGPAGAIAARKPMPGLAPPRGETGPEAPTRLLLAGHSLGFCAEIAGRARQGGAAVREDLWQTHGAGEEEASAAALAWANVVLCEWCLGNAVWYSRNRLDGQRLVVRFHRMELDTDYPGEVDLERVDAVVFVARHVLEAACERWGWDPADPRLRVVPNAIDPAALARPKLPGADFALAAVGYVPRLKRLDRALDVLERLRARDERYRLLVKGREPWEYAWMAGREEDRRYYEELSARLERAPGLREAVEFEPFGDDLPEFLRRAGWILSTGEVEGHPVALAEGMASGAVPVVLERRGAEEQCEARWVHADAAAAADWTLTTQERGEGPTEGEAARRFAERWSAQRLGPVWDELLLGCEARTEAPSDG
jgi:glycosyltransferase involved in cell wall biosynthesis